jgi:hypothetical protein
MNRPSCAIKLIKGADGELVDAVLFEGLSEKNIQDHELIWVPILDAANKAAKEKGEQLVVAEDAHWRWSKKVNFTSGQLAFRHYAIEYENSTEGLMMVALVGHQSRIVPPKDILYIDYLSVAPQNRVIIQNPPKLKIIGSVFFNYAVQISMEEGMNGRVGLHALPNAISWYRDKLELVAFGKDISYHNLEYFELSEERAQKMLEALTTK